ncbi:AraC family transcriptional regulator [Prevotella sp. KH2C16]|uniref:helix-turn-helix transcriptional regulator n=1 Tax=Prevotella sp. KH2C16 TaxID=1855325 RepID=UPI0008F0C5B7|nr:AraC family transcriptional regulator [Prevotella sp. KH2C16]SFG33677.1 AraC-type DNA-binding protein [Prevotella sp. KH2C16]
MNESHVLHEITPLMDKDALYIADRHKKEFSYPIHCHEVCELNFVEHAEGVRRIVGDSNEVIGPYDLVLITSSDLEHVWEQNECKSEDIREITIQFRFGLTEDEGFLNKTPFDSIRRMLLEARKGLVFPLNTIMKVYGKLDTLSRQNDRFHAVIQFLEILYDLSQSEGARTLATTSYAKVDIEDDSRRILKIKNYISQNYMNDLKLKTMADMAYMSESAFSRFFKLHTGRTLSDYIIDIRIGNAARLLIDTTQSISEISFKCGYNNISNFNRIFKRKKGCSPSDFRENYKKVRIIV